MSLTLKSVDTSRVVVGAQVGFGGAGVADFKTNSRRVLMATAGERKVALPLTRAEVGTPMIAEFVAVGSEIIIIGMEVFVIKTASLSPLDGGIPDRRFGA